MEIKKSVVLNTNKSDNKYLSLSLNKFNDLKETLTKEDVLINISEYSNIEDKRNKVIENNYTIKVQDLELMGVRSYNRKDKSKTIYRVRYLTSEVC